MSISVMFLCSQNSRQVFKGDFEPCIQQLICRTFISSCLICSHFLTFSKASNTQCNCGCSPFQQKQCAEVLSFLNLTTLSAVKLRLCTWQCYNHRKASSVSRNKSRIAVSRLVIAALYQNSIYNRNIDRGCSIISNPIISLKWLMLSSNVEKIHIEICKVLYFKYAIHQNLSYKTITFLKSKSNQFS